MSSPTQQSFCGRECEAEALGQRWRFSRWTLRVLDDWTEWARTILPNPIDECAAAILRMESDEEKCKISDPKIIARRNKIKDELVTAAIRQASSYLATSSPEVKSLLNSPRGAAHLLLLLLKPNHPEVTEEKAFDIVQVLGPDLERVMLTTAGRSPPAGGNVEAPAACP